TFELADGRERLEELLAEAFGVEASGWEGAEGTAITSRPETLRFYREGVGGLGGGPGLAADRLPAPGRPGPGHHAAAGDRRGPLLPQGRLRPGVRALLARGGPAALGDR